MNTKKEKKLSENKKLPLVQMINISKSFGHVQALKNVNLELYHNEVLGMVGDNAAGKSTLMKILAGVLRPNPNSGGIYIEGEEISIKNPLIGREAGIGMIYQDFSLCKNMWVAGSIFMGREPTKGFFGRLIGLLDKKRMAEEAKVLLENQDVNPNIYKKKVGALSGGQQQSVAIARAVGFNARVIIMDEPTSSLGVKQATRLIKITTQLKENGISVIFISHRMQDIFAVSDRIFILKNGEKVGVYNKEELNISDVINLMIGEKLKLMHDLTLR
ncbi:MAG: ATP-binding cassette domain-containing protein [Candidatus Humimicrobiaceae bacterium]